MSADRHYLPARYPHYADRIPCLSDIGNTLKISGVVVQGMGATAILLTPSGTVFAGGAKSGGTVHGQMGEYSIAQPTLDEWGEIIRASDDPQCWVTEAGKVDKILARKLRFEISGFTQQRIWHRDGFKCCYCGQGLPQVQLTCDHWIPLIESGSTTADNIITACRRCNKRKGDISPDAFCRQYGYDYERISKYVESLK